MRVPLKTVVEEEKSDGVSEEALDNKINTFHHTIDADLKKTASDINSTEKSSTLQHKTVMQGLSALVTQRDIQKSMNSMVPAKGRTTVLSQTRGILHYTG
jgi:hypothetical protein